MLPSLPLIQIPNFVGYTIVMLFFSTPLSLAELAWGAEGRVMLTRFFLCALFVFYLRTLLPVRI